MTTPLLIRAAEQLEGVAVDLMKSHTVDGNWPEAGEPSDAWAYKEYLSLLRLSKELRDKQASDVAFGNALSEAFNSGDGSYRP